MIETITKKTHPREWAIIKKVLPNYRKRIAHLSIQKSTTLYGRFWNGGSKTVWFLLRNGQTEQVAARNDYPFTAPDIEVDLTDGTIAISTGTFCGKASSACLYKVGD